MLRPNDSSYIEPCVVQTDYADGLAAVEIDRNGNAHVVLYREQRDMTTGGMERHIVTRFVMPRDGMVEAANAMLATANAARPSLAHRQTLRGMN